MASFPTYISPKLAWAPVMALVNGFCVGNFEIFVAMNCFLFVTLYTIVDCYHWFRGICYLHLQGTVGVYMVS